MRSNYSLTLDSNYLRAIQNLEGVTLSEKKKTIHKIANNITEYYKTSGDELSSLKTYIYENISLEFSSLIFLLVSSDLEYTEGVIESLKSSNNFIFNYALKVKWFFDGSCKETVSPNFYDLKIFPYISLKNRIKIIKTLSVSLISSESNIAEKLYDYISEKFLRTQAIPLLSACSSKFILNKLKDNFFIIPVNIYENIFRKHPLLLVDYIKMFPKNSSKTLPYNPLWLKLIAYDISGFFELKDHICIHYSSKLSLRKIKYLIEKGSEFITDDPDFFLKLISRKNLPLYMNDEDIEKMLRKKLPIKKENLKFDDICYFSRNFAKNKNCSKILSSIYKEIYGLDIIEDKEKLTTAFVIGLSNNERVIIAKERCISQSFSSWAHQYKDIWVSLLPTEESIPIINENIQSCKKPAYMYVYWKIIVRTCKINEDKNALVRFLKNIHDNYIDYPAIMVFNLLLHLIEEYKIDRDLCIEIEKVIRKLHFGNVLKHQTNREKFSSEDLLFLHLKDFLLDNILILLDKVLEFKVKNNDSIEEFIRIYCRVYIDSYGFQFFFNELNKDRSCKKICLLTALKILPFEISKEKEMPTFKLYFIIYNLLASINKLNSSKRYKKIIDIKEHNWIFDKVKNIIEDSDHVKFFGIYSFYELLYKEFPEIIGFKGLVKLQLKLKYISPLQFEYLKNNLKNCILKINEISDLLISTYKEDKFMTRYFIRCCMWYNEFPIVLLDKFIKEFQKNTNDNNFELLTLLCDKDDLEKIYNSIYIKCNEEDFYRSILKGLHLSNNLLNINYIEMLSQKEYCLDLIDNIQNLAMRYPLKNLRPFILRLMNGQGNLRKKGFEMFNQISTFSDIELMNIKEFDKNIDQNLRVYILRYIFKLFIIRNT